MKPALPRVGYIFILALVAVASMVSFRVTELNPYIVTVVYFALAIGCALSFFRQSQGHGRAERKIAALERQKRMMVDRNHRFIINRIIELRRPLQGLVGIQDLFSSDKSRDSADEYFEIADFCSRYLIHQLERLQLFAELERKTLRYEKQDIVLKTVVGSAISLAHEQAHAKGIKIVEDWSPELPEQLRTYGRAVKEMVVELVDNAVRFGSGGTVHIRILPDTHDVRNFCIHVTDSGPGMGPANRMRQGLGLTLVKKIADKIGAKISTDSRQGIGTTVSLSFQAEHVSAAALIEKKAGRAPTKPLKILVVDDESFTRQVVSAMVNSLGYSVETAINGHDALAKVQRERFDLIFMDLEMPVLDGLAASNIILNELHLKGTPHIAVLSSHCTQEDRDRIEKIGVTQFLAKPASPADLKRAIEMAYEKVAENMALDQEVEELMGDLKSVSSRVVESEEERGDANYLINFNQLYTSLGENLSMCRQILFSASETFAADAELLGRAVEEKNYGDCKKILHKLRGEAGMIMCEPLVHVIAGMQDAVKAKDESRIVIECVSLKNVINQVLAEIEGLNQPAMQAA